MEPHQWAKIGNFMCFSYYLNDNLDCPKALPSPCAYKKTTNKVFEAVSDDFIWIEEPINITRQVKQSEWYLFAPAPGSGITLADGTLVFPSQGKDKNQLPFSNITYSIDGGQTWQASNPSITIP